MCRLNRTRTQKLFFKFKDYTYFVLFPTRLIYRFQNNWARHTFDSPATLFHTNIATSSKSWRFGTTPDNDKTNYCMNHQRIVIQAGILKRRRKKALTWGIIANRTRKFFNPSITPLQPFSIRLSSKFEGGHAITPNGARRYRKPAKNTNERCLLQWINY